MSKRILRRHMLQWAGVSAATVASSRLLVGCGDECAERESAARDASARPRDGGGDASADGDAGVLVDAAPSTIDPDAAWWNAGNFAGVEERADADALSIEGAIPPELDGLYLRNGPNASEASGHWFSGHGMLHGVRIENGRALWFKNRYVQTPTLGAVSDEGSIAPPTLEGNASNVSVFAHAGKLLSSGEVGLPYEISPDDLSTIGPYDFDGALMTPCTAHPKIDARTGELLFFGYNFAAPYLTYHRANAQGQLLQSEPLSLPGPAMIHDFLVTERYVIFMDVPVTFQLQLALDGAAIPFGWDDNHGTRIGVMPREGSDADMRWFEVDPCFVFHFMNAHEQGDTIVFEAARYETWWKDDSENFDQPAYLFRYEIDLAAGRVRQSQLDDRQIEFPQLNRDYVGRDYRYGYTLRIGNPSINDGMGEVTGILKWDHQSGETVAHDFAPGVVPGEAFFVPAEGGTREDDGYLMTYAYDGARNLSDLLILDASNLRAAPLAKIALPQRVPFGFHGYWVPKV